MQDITVFLQWHKDRYKKWMGTPHGIFFLIVIMFALPIVLLIYCGPPLSPLTTMCCVGVASLVGGIAMSIAIWQTTRRKIGGVLRHRVIFGFCGGIWMVWWTCGFLSLMFTAVGVMPQ
jgi:hypothetical protein